MNDKLRGGYYTPPEIAEFLVLWALNGSEESRSVLEPSMGDGAFILPLVRELSRRGVSKEAIAKNIYGVELFKQEVEKVKNSLKKEKYNPDKFNIFSGDFFSTIEGSLKDKKFDLILGNPPFIRYQNFPEGQRKIATEILARNGFHPNKLTNAWLFFLAVSIFHLKEEGKLAMVIPAELLQVSYAAETRVFLSNIIQSITIVSFKKLTFKGIQQEVVLLLCDKSKKAPKGINFVELSDASELPPLAEIKSPARFKPVDHDTDKWTQYFLTQKEILLLRKLGNNKKISRLGDLMGVDVGIVTGNNNFFVVNNETVNKYGLSEFVIPLIGRSAQFNSGLRFTKKEWNVLNKKNGLCHLFSFNKEINDVSDGVKKYLQVGVKDNVPLGFKCRTRKSWHLVPSIWIPEGLMFRQIHNNPRLILNEAKAVPTDTIHRVRFEESVDKKNLVASFHNSLTFACSEVFGRSYGGGVLELEPSEAESLLVPYFPKSKIDIDKLEKIIEDNGIEAGLDYTDEVLLGRALKLSKIEINILRQIWKKLSQRRLRRKGVK